MGPPTKEDMEVAGTAWEADDEWEKSEAEEEPASGFWGTSGKAKKEKNKND